MHYCNSLYYTTTIVRARQDYFDSLRNFSCLRFSLPYMVDYAILKKRPFERMGGGRYKTRTCDPIDVNDVLYQLC